MMNINRTITSLLASLVLSCSACATPSAQHLSTASEHSAMATVHGLSAVGKGVASVAAVPLLVVGSAGAAVGTAGSALVDFASAPLPLGDELKDTTTPDPATALQRKR